MTAAHHQDTAPRDYPELTPEQVARLIVALERWVANSPEPDEPFMILYKDEVSQRAILEAVRDAASEDGRRFIRLVRAALDVATFDELIAGFERVPVTAT
jgi:hypothetical protein